MAGQWWAKDGRRAGVRQAEVGQRAGGWRAEGGRRAGTGRPLCDSAWQGRQGSTNPLTTCAIPMHGRWHKLAKSAIHIHTLLVVLSEVVSCILWLIG